MAVAIVGLVLVGGIGRKRAVGSALFAAGVIVGMIAVSFIKPLGIITTALSGGKLIAKYSIIQFSNLLSHYPSFFIILAVSAAIGIIFQFKSCKHLE